MIAQEMGVLSEGLQPYIFFITIIVYPDAVFHNKGSPVRKDQWLPKQNVDTVSGTQPTLLTSGEPIPSTFILYAELLPPMSFMLLICSFCVHDEGKYCVTDPTEANTVSNRSVSAVANATFLSVIKVCFLQHRKSPGNNSSKK